MFGEPINSHVADKSYTITIDRVLNGWVIRCGMNVFVVEHSGMQDYTSIYNAIQSAIRKYEG